MYNKMKAAGQLASSILDELTFIIKEGVTTDFINDFCHERMIAAGAIPGALNYGQPPFPKSVCVSVNEVVCHGISSGYKLKNGDIVSVDVALQLNGVFGDNCRTYKINVTDPRVNKLVEVAYGTMCNAIKIIKPGVHVGTLGHAMQSYAESFGFNVIRDFAGHGIGFNMHESPSVLFYGKVGDGPVLKAGQYITIEPMVTMGKWKLHVAHDGWTAIMNDRAYAAQFEHTIYVTETGYEVMTFSNYDREQEVLPQLIS